MGRGVSDPRAQGWLTAKALRNGMREQVAVVVGTNVHRVTLRTSPMGGDGFVVQREVFRVGQPGPTLNDPATEEWGFDRDLLAARHAFTAESAAARSQKWVGITVKH